MKLKLRVLSVFGNERFYPDCDLGYIVRDLKKTTCIGRGTLEIVVKHNVEIEYEAMENSEFLDSIGAKRV